MENTKTLRLLSLIGVVSLLASCSPGNNSSSSAFSSVSSSTSSSGEASSSTSAVDYGASTHDEDSPADLNIYFYSKALYSNRDWVWAWNDTSSYGFQTGQEQVTFSELGDDFEFTPIYLTFGKDYAAYGDWAYSAPVTMDVTDQNFFTGIIFRSQDGSSQTADLTIDTSKIVEDENGHYDVYIYENRGVYYSLADFPTSPVDSVSYIAKGSEGDYSYYVDVKGSGLKDVFPTIDGDHALLKPYALDGNGDKEYEEALYFDSSSTVTDTEAKLYLSSPLDITKKYEFWSYSATKDDLESGGDVSFLNFYGSDAFDSAYYTDLDLGANIEDGNTVFRLWSPSASAVTLNIYDTNDASAPSSSTSMTKDGNGVFTSTASGNLHGKYYTFDVTNYGVTDIDVPDPYARSSNANGKRSMVVDFSKADQPEGFDQATWAPVVENYAGVSVMEMHTRDMTASPSWDGSEANRGKFTGLYETGTALSDGTPTGFDYVKELHEKGLTHVQIQPAYDFSSVDETKLDDADYQDAATDGIYNWGYDPQQYDAPEGSYSSDPDDGLTRVNEFRDFVNAYNQAGVGVIMDVVYNHMPSQNGTSFERVFPGYYFRSTSYSGAGVDIASQRSMVRKFIVDSVTMWAREYHVSGFRFDLMGLLDLTTMEEVRQALNAIDPNILVYGEGWQQFAGDSSSGLDKTDMASQAYLYKLGNDWVGAFNDTFRDGMKGSVFDSADKGYVQLATEDDLTGLSSLKKDVYYGLTGTYDQTTGAGNTYVATSDSGIGASIAYVECHDNLTLHDKLAVSTGDTDLLDDQISLANDTLLSSLSPAFFQVGQSFGRSKKITDNAYLVSGKYVEDPNQAGVYYSSDSYNLGDEVNAVDWTLLDTNRELESRFETALSERASVSSAFTANPVLSDFRSASTVYARDLIDDPQVISFSYKVSADHEYLAIQNYGDGSVTYDGITVQAFGSYAGIVNA